MVLRHRPNPKFLPLRPLRPRLEIPLVQPTRTRLGSCPFGNRLLRGRLGRPPLGLRDPVKIPLLDPTHVRRRTRRSAMVPDVVGHIGHGPLGSMGWITSRGRYGRTYTVALARCSRCHPRRRVRHDPAPDADEISHRLHARLGAGAR